MSSVTKQVLVIVKQQGLDQVNTSIKGLTTTTTAATKSTTGLSDAFSKGQGSVLNLRTGVANLDTSEKKAVKTTTTFAKETDKAGKSTSGLAAKFQGNKGLIFATVGITTAGLEAIGMWQQWQNASAKVSEAQDRLTKLQQAGITSGKEYESAQRDVTDAQRGQQFALRILTLSMGDMIPFSLLLINSMFKLRETFTASKTATDAVSQGVTALGNTTRAAATGGLASIATSAGGVTTGLTNVGNASRLSNTAIGNLLTTSTNFDRGLTTVNTRVMDATRLLGNNNSGLTGGYYGLSGGIDDSTKRSTRFRDAFVKIGDQIRALPGHFTSAGSKIKDFFLNFGTNLGKLPGLFRTAGTAVAGFGKALLGLALNPIGLAIIGVSSAVLALATDFGGVRTALNNVGVAIGNAIPQLKGILDAIGGAANGALDYVAGMLGIETSSEKAAAKAEQLGKVLRDPLVMAIQDVVNVGDQLQNLDTVVQKFDAVRAEIEKLSGSSSSTIGVMNTFDTAIADVSVTSENAQAQIDAFNKLVVLLNNSTLSGEEKQKLLTIALNAVNAALGKDISQLAADNKAKQLNEQASKKVQAATLGVSEGVIASWSAYQKLTAEQGKGTQSTDKNAEAVAQLAMKYGIVLPDDINTATEQQKLFIQSLYDNAPAFDLIEGHIDLTSGKAIDLGDVLVSMAATQEDNRTKALALWGDMKNGILSVGADAFPIIENALEYLKLVHPDIHKVVSELYEDYKDELQDSGKFVEVLGTKEQKRSKDVETMAEEEKKALQETAQEVAYKADKYGILDEITGKSLETQQTAIKFHEEEKKAQQEVISTLQQMALARGLDESKLTENTAALLNYIKTHRLEKVSTDEIIEVVAKEIDAREKDARAMALQEAAASHFLATAEKQIHVTGMTGEGLMKLVDIYADTANASGIAADSVGLWYGELEKSAAVEDATRAKLEEFAKIHKINVPDAIRNGSVKSFQEYVDEVMNIALETDKSMQMIQDAIKKGLGQMSSSFSKISSDAGKAFGEGKKAFNDFLDETGLNPDNPLILQGIVEMIMNDVNFQDKFTGFQENLASRIKDLQGATTGEITTMVEDWKLTIADEMKKNPEALAAVQAQADEIISTMNTVMKSGDVTGVEAFLIAVGQVLGKDEMVKTAELLGAKTVDGLVQKLEAGKGAVTSGTKNGIGDPLQKTLQNLPQIGDKVGGEVITSVGGKLAAGANTIGNEVQTGINQPITQNLDKVPGEAEGAIQPVPGIFNQTFLDASQQAGTQLQNIVTAVQTKMSSMSTSVDTYSKSMAANFNMGLAEMLVPMLPFGEALVALQQIFSNLSSNVATYMSSLTNNVLQWMANTGQSMPAYTQTIVAVQQAFSNLSSNVATYASSMKTNIQNFVTTSNTNLGGLNATTKAAQGAFSTTSTSVKTYMSSMTTNISSFATSAGSSMGKAADAAKKAQSQLSNMSTSVSTYMSSMSSKVSSFASSASSAFSKVGSAADSAKKKVDALKKSIDALKSKTITITVNARGSGLNYLRSGGSFVSFNPTGFAQTGKTFINSKPRKIGGVNISEFGKPELVSVIPLSNPGDPTDRNISMDMATPKISSIPQMTSGLRGSGLGGGGNGQPITVTGNLNVSVMMPDGRVLAKEVNKYSFEGFSGIT